MNPTPPTRICKDCGNPIPSNSRNNWCPHCLMKLGLEAGLDEDHEDESDTGQPGTTSDAGSLASMLNDVAESLGKAARTLVAPDYEHLEEIGHGGMGVVYKARQISLNRLVALKMIRSGTLATKEEVQRFLNEAQAVASLEHPNIVALHAVGKNDGQYFLSMQLIHGSDLAKVIQAREDSGQMPALPCRQAVEIMIKVARAVLHAHQRRILHRDLKPSNILLDEQGEPHVVDFGMARRIDVPTGMTPQGSAIGTPGYMSPEQAQGRNDELTTLTDVYGLGAVLYFLLTGLPPIRGKSDLETLQMVLDKEPVRPSLRNPKVNRYLEIICLNCLEKDPQQRYPSAELLAEDLERWLEGLPPKKTPVGLVERSIRLVRRNRSLACAMAAVFVLFVCVIWLVADRAAQRKRVVMEERYRRLLKGVEDFYAKPEVPYFLASSEDRRELAGRGPLWTLGSNSNAPLVFAVYTHSEPAKMIENFSPVLEYLEAKLERPINFRIYKGYSNANQALLKGEVQFMRPGPASYVKIKAADSNVVLLAQQLHNGTNIMFGSIFTRAERPITDMHDLATFLALTNYWFAFGDEDSTFGSYLARGQLVDAGLTDASFAGHKHFLTHPATIRAVLSDSNFVAGAANAGKVKEFIDNGDKLTVITNMESVTFPWVGATNLPPDTARQIKSALLQLENLEILHAIDPALTGFQAGRPADYNQMERQLPKAEQFEKGRRSPSK